ncbi:hypothetical protein ABWL39_10425 [Chitinivorax sp. PXF-14]|uniref:hypothetical protein n=1 Tax=Chitinivorax sp. PXF-14 TaxID=3230488 RepID=UPI003466F22A
MRVSCVATTLSVEQKRVLGVGISENPLFQLTIGSAYVVLGLAYQVGYYAGPILQVRDDFGKCVFAPLCLFDIVDSRPSKYWVAKRLGDFELALWPEEFFVEYFHDDLSNREPAAVKVFHGVIDKLENEFVD